MNERGRWAARKRNAFADIVGRGGAKEQKCHVTLATPFCHPYRLEFAMVYLCTSLVATISIRYEYTKGEAKGRNDLV